MQVIKSRIMRLAGYVAHMEELRNGYKILGGKPEGKTLLQRPRCRWEDNMMVWTGFTCLVICSSVMGFCVL